MPRSNGRESSGGPESPPHRIGKKYELIDHTADFGIRVFGADPQELFANAAHALFDIVTDIDGLETAETITLQIAGDDWADLMVNWLRELLYLFNGSEKLVRRVRILSLSESSLHATVGVDTFDPDRHEIKAEIKAVTYHQIHVGRRPAGWEAKIIFDI